MIKTYTVVIEETLRKEIKVNAENKEDALAIAEEVYNNEEVVLYPEDMIKVEFETLND